MVYVFSFVTKPNQVSTSQFKVLKAPRWFSYSGVTKIVAPGAIPISIPSALTVKVTGDETFTAPIVVERFATKKDKLKNIEKIFYIQYINKIFNKLV